MAERAEPFLARVRAALARAGAWRAQSSPRRAPSPLALEGETAVERFQRELEAIGGKVQRVDRAQVLGRIVELAAQHTLRSFAAWRTPLLESLQLAQGLEAAGLQRLADGDGDGDGDGAGPGDRRERYRALDLGLSDADLGFAETGSLLLGTGAGRSRLITAMARVHVVVLPVERIVASLTELPPLLRADRAGLGSNAVVITGPSRTADIENVLVVGIHGPVALHVLLLTSPEEKNESEKPDYLTRK